MQRPAPRPARGIGGSSSTVQGLPPRPGPSPGMCAAAASQPARAPQSPTFPQSTRQIRIERGRRAAGGRWWAGAGQGGGGRPAAGPARGRSSGSSSSCRRHAMQSPPRAGTHLVGERGGAQQARPRLPAAHHKYHIHRLGPLGARHPDLRRPASHRQERSGIGHSRQRYAPPEDPPTRPKEAATTRRGSLQPPEAAAPRGSRPHGSGSRPPRAPGAGSAPRPAQSAACWSRAGHQAPPRLREGAGRSVCRPKNENGRIVPPVAAARHLPPQPPAPHLLKS